MISIVMIFILANTTSCTESKYQSNIEALDSFIQENMRSEIGGIYTNYIDAENDGIITKGHDVLSESIGLDLEIAVLTKDRKRFQKAADYLEKYFIDEKDIIYWRLDEKTKEKGSVNATIDDLRIIRALMDGYKIWKNKEDLELANRLERGLINHSVYGEYLLNHSDSDLIISIVYQDLKTMKTLESNNDIWRDIRINSIEIIDKAYIGDEFPFYHSSYDISKGSYIMKDEINMTESLVTILHLSESGRVKAETISWINQNIDEKIYTHYRSGDWKPSSEKESTAIYALIARISQNIDNQGLKIKALEKLSSFQIDDTKNLFNGAFGDIETKEIYSFDLLQAMLAYLEG